MMPVKLRALARHIPHYDLAPALARMDVGVVLYIPEVTKATAIGYRNACYYASRKEGRAKIWKTHMRADGFYIERWK